MAKPYRILRAQLAPEAQAQAAATAQALLAWTYACDRCRRRVPDLRRCQVCALDVCALCLGLRPGDACPSPACTVHGQPDGAPDNCA